MWILIVMTLSGQQGVQVSMPTYDACQKAEDRFKEEGFREVYCLNPVTGELK